MWGRQRIFLRATGQCTNDQANIGITIYQVYLSQGWYLSIDGSMVECSPATRATRVRFPVDALFSEIYKLVSVLFLKKKKGCIVNRLWGIRKNWTHFLQSYHFHTHLQITSLNSINWDEVLSVFTTLVLIFDVVITIFQPLYLSPFVRYVG